MVTAEKWKVYAKKIHILIKTICGSFVSLSCFSYIIGANMNNHHVDHGCNCTHYTYGAVNIQLRQQVSMVLWVFIFYDALSQVL